ncbi:uncharacterized protein LOC125747060 [Brienomyrus brachyistius]|uniref:uncharacterized protein LOC125747060 n=1 Tax=Brienomyrus brachyistius TaxID=42636 RepID=UPI0020B24BFA|nr:uncharacterized protein LOC125747060 [Brienomyrus brachyistius]XP_048877741.1 uncharacterized protein LOC125747060 [Brienomyrus brachyistius]
MAALDERFGKPHQLALKKIATVMDLPDVRRGDTSTFERFALQINALVSMLKTLGPEGEAELRCGSNVARLLTKLPPDMRANFRRHAYKPLGAVHTLGDLAEWLQYECHCQGYDGLTKGTVVESSRDRRDRRREDKPPRRTATILHGTEEVMDKAAELVHTRPPKPKKPSSRSYCPYCDSPEHFLSQCSTFMTFTKEQKFNWLQSNKRCWRCGRTHQAAQCTLKKPCSICQRTHLQILHDVNDRTAREGSCLVSSAGDTLYLNRPPEGSKVLLKVIRVILSNGNKKLDTFAVLDDGSERTMLLPAAAHQLGLKGHPEDLSLRTIRQDIQVLHGAAVSFQVASAVLPQKRFQIHNAFTAAQLGLAQHSYPITTLQERYRYLKGLPLQPFHKANPLLLIGADHPHLVTPIEPVRLGPRGGPAAVKTRLGWTLQGPAKALDLESHSQECLFTSLSSDTAELLRNVEKLWEMDTLPYRNEKLLTRSKEDQEAVYLLESRTTRVEVDGTYRYATPLLRRKGMPLFQAPAEAVLPLLRTTERRLAKNPNQAAVYRAEITKLVEAGYIAKLPPEAVRSKEESWYLPHHMVQHNGKYRVVFNCSFLYKGLNLNKALLPGPQLSSSLLGVLLRFREHAVAVSGDIRSMFHQIRLLPEDKPILRFAWRDLKSERAPDIYEWQVLPFGTTCSPCCASYALQKHVLDHSEPGDSVRVAVMKSFYVDNCIQSVSSPEEAKDLVEQLRILLSTGGFDIRQWASNVAAAVSHLPKEARAESTELWLSYDKVDTPEPALGLHWHCSSDTLRYKHRLVKYTEPTMRNIYRILASQYDPLGFLIPFTTRAKVLVQQLWAKPRQWDDPLLPEDLLCAWRKWEEELKQIPEVSIPRCYTSQSLNHPEVKRSLHIFCDASERAYGSVAYLRSEDNCGHVEVAFLMARSRVAPKKQQSMPRLELCAALTGAQLLRVLENELTLHIQDKTLWTDSTTVLSWLQSESCRFKVFVGTRISEILEITDDKSWRYVDTASNPADDITRGKRLSELTTSTRWSNGPPFLLQHPDKWPVAPITNPPEVTEELRRVVFCGITGATSNPPVPNPEQFDSWQGLVEATAQHLIKTASPERSLTAETYIEAEHLLYSRAQQESFPEEFQFLKAGKPVPPSSRLLTLSSEFDENHTIIRVGGRLRKAQELEDTIVHPIVMDPKHPVTRLLIKDYDHRLCHPGPGRVFAEMRRSLWILRGREAIKRHQRTCIGCQRWRAKATPPRMADLPPARLRLFKPAFHSTGVDCFGPLTVKLGRRQEKRWGIIYKCLTTRAVHLDLLPSIDTDAFLMSMRRFVARRGTPAELYSDQGTNFRGGERELKEAFQLMGPELRHQLAKQKISFHFNPPASPHFGGAWEREVRSVKVALRSALGSQTVTEEVLATVLIEVEAILNAKPLGYTSSSILDPDPITPNHLLMGRPDGSLPQVVYPAAELLSRRRWRHSQVLADRFWTAFIKDYLPTLQYRQKWHSLVPTLAVGSVVMVVDHQLPRGDWPIGQVTKVFPGSDGQVRTVEVKIKDRVYTRPVVKLIVLPELPSDEESRPSTI